MDTVPLDYRLFDPPPKQRKQQQQSAGTKASSPKDHQRQASDEYSKNSANHPNLPGSVSGKIRSKASDTNSSGNSLAGEFQCQSNSVPTSNIVQSGSYVEILKQTANPVPSQSHERLTAIPKNQITSSVPLACHNKSYGDFLTITPRRKGKLLSANADHKGIKTEGNDNYRHHLPQSIEPLHLLGIPNDNMSTFFDYRAMETLSNAETLAIGSTMATHIYPSNGIKESSPAPGSVQCERQVPDEFHHIISEKNLSPPSAFCDNISTLNKA